MSVGKEMLVFFVKVKIEGNVCQNCLKTLIFLSILMYQLICFEFWVKSYEFYKYQPFHEILTTGTHTSEI